VLPINKNKCNAVYRSTLLSYQHTCRECTSTPVGSVPAHLSGVYQHTCRGCTSTPVGSVPAHLSGVYQHTCRACTSTPVGGVPAHLSGVVGIRHRLLTLITPLCSPMTSQVRLTSKAVFNGGLFILDVEHIPTGCASWPAFWIVGPNWPVIGARVLMTSADCTRGA
jgi:hypothetical protein